MVMRKFKKPEDIAASPPNPDGSMDDLANPLVGLNSPRITRKNRGGSFSGQLVLDPQNAGYDSPSVRRRRSRIPSEEDDKLVRIIFSFVQFSFLPSLFILSWAYYIMVWVAFLCRELKLNDVIDLQLHFFFCRWHAQFNFRSRSLL